MPAPTARSASRRWPSRPTRAAGPPVAGLHPTVRLARVVALEQAGKLTGVHHRIEAFHATGKPADVLYAEAGTLVGRFRRGAGLLGAWFGLVIAVKLVHLNLRRARTEYIADPARCVACGRCFWYCPLEQARRGWITEAEKQAWLASLEGGRDNEPGDAFAPGRTGEPGGNGGTEPRRSASAPAGGELSQSIPAPPGREGQTRPDPPN